ncbi:MULTISPECIES: hypothetical protein [Chryseobacterium]|uniref:hypothetical protein n=1 Tax=Chryseobacterium TaxID=59732 RepID=UPI001296FAB3|nr:MULTISPECIES: hypothetical protein [Chryseobacterium]MDR6921950.1 hypothetical protein [Chryseobacterium sp. 2987]
MKKLLYFLLLIIIVVSCTTISAEHQYKNTDKGELYFPSFDSKKYKIDSINTGPNDSLREFTNKWYSRHLYTLKEPVLSHKKDKNLNIIRFTHLGTWSNPYSYRIEQVGLKFILTYNKTNGLGGYEPGTRTSHKTKEISQKEWNKIITKMDKINFWNIPTHGSNKITDGSEWIFEALIDGKYHLVTRNSPDHYNGEEYAELCKLVEKIGK